MGSHSLNDLGSFPVNFQLSEINQRQQRLGLMQRHKFLDLFRPLIDISGGAGAREIQQENLLAVVDDELDSAHSGVTIGYFLMAMIVVILDMTSLNNMVIPFCKIIASTTFGERRTLWYELTFWSQPFSVL